MRLIILFLALFSLSLALPIVNIDSDKSDITNFKLAHLIDNTGKLEFKDIRNMPFIESKNNDCLGVKVKVAWIKIELFNSTKEKQTLFLHQDLAYKYISLDYFEVSNNDALIRTEKITPFGPLAKEQLNGADAIFKFALDPKETKTIYIRQETLAYHYYSFSILSEKESIKHLIYQKVDAVLIAGLLLALALYNLLIYLTSRYKEHLYYSMYLVSSTLWIFYVYGSLAHYFQMYGDIPVRFNFFIMLSPVFLALFIQTLFKTKTRYAKEHKLLNSVIVLSVSNFIYGLIDFTSALEIMSLTINYALVMFVWISISIARKGDKLIKIFLYANTICFIFSGYALLYYMGFVGYSYTASHGTSIGMIIEALLLSYLVSNKFKMMEQEKEEERMKQIELKLLASTDPMTKLYNRRYLTEISQKLLSISKREEKEFSVVIADIDKFKDVNDTYGHQFGDEVLIALSRLLVKHQRQSDIVCRYGGEEFVILLPNTSLEDATIVAQKIRESVESLRIVLPSNKEFKFTISLGVSNINVQSEKEIEEALKRADRALYNAKESGRNKVCFEKYTL